MLFSEFQFWIFFAVVVLLYLVLAHRAQNRMLLVASYVFYGAWDWRFLGLMLFSTVISWGVSLAMEQSRSEVRRHQLFIISIVASLSVLGVFKYLNFFLDSATLLLEAIGLPAHPLALSIVLPVGISFYTFQTMSYTIDVHRRDIKPCVDFFDYALFVAFFPQLVAGPIERATHLLPEIQNPRQVTWDNLGRGAVLCLTGLIKKIVIADAISPSVDSVFASPDPSGAAVLLASWLFAIQIYCDFSGYTDIARGVAKILGFDLMRNFSQPYFATNPQEFWRRWHISLSTWLRDYLYIGLGGNRKGPRRTQVNLMATMVLGGLWHGAAWNFVLWGAYQGLLLALHRAVLGRRPAARVEIRSLGALIGHVIKVVLFFQVICYGWLLFRATSFAQIVDFTWRLTQIRLADFTTVEIASIPLPAVLGIGALVFWDLAIELSRNPRVYLRLPRPLRAGFYAAMIYFLAFGATTGTGAFIYFQF